MCPMSCLIIGLSNHLGRHETHLRRINYARVSSVEQSLEVQRDKLKHCDKVFQEQKSGTSDQPPKLKACLESVRPGDTLVVTRLDRLARSTFIYEELLS